MAAEPLGVIGCVVGVAGFAYTAMRNRRADEKEILDRLKAGELRLERLETKVEVFWRTVGVQAAEILHSPHIEHARRDYLIERYVDGTLTADELNEFRHLLQALVNNAGASPVERITAGQLLTVLQQQFPC